MANEVKDAAKKTAASIIIEVGKFIVLAIPKVLLWIAKKALGK